MRKGLSDTAATSLQTKAAILGVMYALERLFAASGQRGTSLTNFNALLGVSAKTLQQYQYAAQQVGVSNEEVEGSFKSLQATMTKTLMGEGAPKGLARVAALTGGMTAEDIKRFAEQPQLLIQKLQEYAGKETNAGLRNEVLKSFGVGDGMISAMNRQAFRPDVMKKAPTYSDGEIKALDKANIAWSNLGTKIQMAIGHFNAAKGGKLVGEIGQLVDQVLKLALAFEKLADKAKFFEAIGMAFKGWTDIFEGATKAAEAITGAVEDPKKKETLKEDVLSFITSDLPNMFRALSSEFGTDEAAPTARALKPDAEYMADRTKKLSIVPNIPATAAPATGSTQNISVNQNLNFQHDGTDSRKTGDSVKKAVQDAYRQSAAQAQVK